MQDLFSLLFIAGWIYWTHKDIEMLIIHRYPPPNTFIMALYIFFCLTLTPPLVHIWIYFRYIRNPKPKAPE